MNFSLQMDAASLAQKIRGLGPAINRETVATIRKVTNAYVRHLSRERMSGRRGNVGLYRRTGTLAKSLIARTLGTTVRDVKGIVGVSSAKAAQIARVHELGTVGKGGRLPDIVPRRAKWLVFRVLTGTTAAATPGGSTWMRAKKVAIPPRLGFYATFKAAAFQAVIKREIKAGAERIIKSVKAARA